MGWAGLVSVVTTGWMIQGSNPSGGEIFCICPNWTWGSSSLLYNGYSVRFLGVKQPGCGIDHPPLGLLDLLQGRLYIDFSYPGNCHQARTFMYHTSLH